MPPSVKTLKLMYSWCLSISVLPLVNQCLVSFHWTVYEYARRLGLQLEEQQRLSRNNGCFNILNMFDSFSEKFGVRSLLFYE